MTNIPTEYVFDFIRMIIKMRDNVIIQIEGVDEQTIKWYIEVIFFVIDEATTNVLTDDFFDKVIEK